MLLHILLPTGPKGLWVLCLGPPWHHSPLKGDLELCKTCVSVCTPVVLCSERVEERWFGAVNRPFTLLMSQGVGAVSRSQGAPRSAQLLGGWLSSRGSGKETRADLRS